MQLKSFAKCSRGEEIHISDLKYVYIGSKFCTQVGTHRVHGLCSQNGLVCVGNPSLCNHEQIT